MIEPEPVPEPQPIRPAIIEPLTAGAIRAAAGQSSRSFKPPEPALETEMAFEAPAPDPQVTQPPARPVARIVDPSVADDEDEPLFPETPRFGQERQSEERLAQHLRPPAPRRRAAAAAAHQPPPSQAQPALEEAADAGRGPGDPVLPAPPRQLDRSPAAIGA